MSDSSCEFQTGCGCLLILLGIILCFTCTKQAISVVQEHQAKKYWSSELAYPEPIKVEEPLPEPPIYTPEDDVSYNLSYGEYELSKSSSTSIDWSRAMEDTADFFEENPEVLETIIDCAKYLFDDYKRGGGGHLQHYDSSTGRYD